MSRARLWVNWRSQPDTSATSRAGNGLDQNSECVDLGDDASATADYVGLGLDWETMTTDVVGTLDVSPVDAGAHYEP